MHRAGICLNLFSFLFTFSEIWGSIENFLLENKELIGTLGALLVIIIIFPYRNTFKLLCNVKNSIFQNARKNYHYLNVYFHFIPFYIKGKELYELKKIFKNKKTKVIVITGDVKSRKKDLLEKFLSELQRKRIKLKNYHLLRYDLSNTKSKKDLISRISNDLKERGRERLHKYFNGGYALDEIQKVLIQELNSRSFILSLENLNPSIHIEILDMISSTMRFYDKTKVILISETCPERFNYVDRLYGIVKILNVNYYNLAELKQILDKDNIRYSFENITKIKEMTNGCPDKVYLFIYYLKEKRIYDLTINEDWVGIFYEPRMKALKQEIVYERYGKVYLNLEEDMKIIPQILSALCSPCTLGDLQSLYNQFLQKTEMPEGYKKMRLESFLEDISKYNLISEEDETYFLDGLIKKWIYNDFTLRKKFHEISSRYFEEKLSESPIYEEEYHFQTEKCREIIEIECPNCGKTVSKKDKRCTYCGIILTGSEETQIYDSTWTETEQ